MKLKKVILLITALIFLKVPGLVGAQLRVEKVLLSPTSATVWGTAYATVVKGEDDSYFELKLPFQVEPDTVSISIEEPAGLVITDVFYELVEERDEERLRHLKQKIQEIEKEIDVLQAGAETLGRLTETWLEGAKSNASVGNLLNFMNEAEKRVKALQSERVNTLHELEARKEELKKLKDVYENLAGSADKSWKFRCRVHSESDSLLSAGGKVKVAYRFLFSDAGWKPVYLINGEPAQKRITLTWLAEVWQKSGTDWEDVDLMLATMEPVFNLQPPELPSWNISPLEEQPPRIAESFKMMAPLGLAKAADETMRSEKKSGFMIYHAGKRTIRAGARQRVKVDNFRWNATFSYLLRPYVSSWSFIRGSISLDEGIVLPQGIGLYFLDGVFVKSHPFAFQGAEKTFYFGPDRLVTADMVLIRRETGEQGLIKQKKTYNWEWQFRIRNDHDYPVDVVVEERKPVVTDQRISVEVRKLPESPQVDPRKPGVWIWNFNMPAHHEKVLDFVVSVLVPEDMKVDPGW